MAERSFIDTNLLIYAEASDAPEKQRTVRIPRIVTDDSGIVTVHSGDRDRRLEQAGHSAL